MQGFDHACLCTMVFCYIEDIIPRSMSLSFEDNSLGSFPWLLVVCMLLQNTSCCCIFYGLYLCWILFSIAAWYFAISFLLLKCSHSNYVLGFFSGEFSPFNSFIYASFCFLYAAGMWGHSFVTHWRPSQLLPRAFLSLAGNIFHRNDGHFALTRNQGTKSTEK